MLRLTEKRSNTYYWTLATASGTSYYDIQVSRKRPDSLLKIPKNWNRLKWPTLKNICSSEFVKGSFKRKRGCPRLNRNTDRIRNPRSLTFHGSMHPFCR